MTLVKKEQLLLWAFSLVFVLALSNSSSAQDLKCENDEQKKDRVGKIDSLLVNKGKTRVEVVLTKPISRWDLLRAPSKTWVFVDIMEAAIETPIRIIETPVRGDHRPEAAEDLFGTVLLTLNQSLKEGHAYHLFQYSLTFRGCKPDAPLDIALSIKQEAAAPVTAAVPIKTEKPDFFPRSKTTGRADSSVYLSGEIDGAKGTKTQFSTDIKIDIPFETKTFFDEIGPAFDLKASTAPDADADSFNLGAKLRHVHNISRKADRHEFVCKDSDKVIDPRSHQPVCPDRRILTGLVWDLLPGLESDRRFKNVNSVLGTRLYFVPRVGGGAHSLIYFQPFIGYEIGRNLKSPVAAAEHRGLSRALVGGSFYLKVSSPTSLQFDYIRRFLLRRETSFTEDDNKKLIPLAVGRGPRDYLKSTFEYDFSDFSGVTITYEYGRLPPDFELVNHKFSLGLVHKFSTAFGSK